MRWPDVIAILSFALSGGIFAIVGFTSAGSSPSSVTVIDQNGTASLLDTLLPAGEIGLIMPPPVEDSVPPEPISPEPASSEPELTPPQNPNCININTASEARLITIKGIGPVLANSIIQYRTDHGPFQKKEDIRNVRGIGPAKFAQIIDHICL